jgi:3-oxoacyl-[acyl-carrier protein] reductase
MEELMSAAESSPFSGKVAVITGSAGGIGNEIAREFVRAGADVVLNSRDEQRAAEAARTLQGESGRVIGIQADVSSPEGARKLIEGAVSQFGGVDILINNAGISMIAPADQLDPADWDRAIRTNLSGPFYCSQAAAPHMFERGGGVIVNIGSIAGHVAFPARAAYCAAKHGLVGLSKVLALDWAPKGVRVLNVDPAYIKTAMDERDQTTAGYDDVAIERRTPLGCFGSVGDVAKAVLFLCSPDARYITGSSMLVDGGWVAYGYL